MAADLPMNIYGPTAIWETLSANKGSQGHNWRSWHFDPGGVGEDGESFGGQLIVLVRMPAAYLEAQPDSTASFDMTAVDFHEALLSKQKT